MITIVLFFGCATTREPSRISEYCKRISGTENMKSAGMKSCLENEKNAEKQLSGMTIPWQVESYCRQLSEQTGGSYQVMLICVEEELKN